MDMVLSMSSIHPRDRVAYWHDIACKVFVNHEGRVSAPNAFNAIVHQASLGELTLVDIESLGLESVRRTARNIVHGEDNVFLLCLQLQGSAVMSQDGRDAVIHPGDFTLLDAQRPYFCRYAHRKQITLKIPHRALKARLAGSSELTAYTVRRAPGVSELLSSYVAMVRDRMHVLQPAAKSQIAEHVLDLAALALTTQTTNDIPALSSGRAVALLNLRMAIEKRLTDPKLDPTAAAGAAGISVRYANHLLSQQGTSLERFIMTRRLERCRAALEDHQQNHRTIGEIAYAWGFGDLSHFNRRFKAAYGCTPRDYRRRHLG
jgi:AraC family transcriptional regulator, positive regulator of tynA and feaB